MSRLTIDFFHDVVCGWCFNLSPRMRRLAEEFDLDIRHRTFVLQASPAEMAQRWGTPANARKTILDHWEMCRSASDTPELFNIEGMRQARFDYPHGMVAALACKTAETIGGPSCHWDMFDRLQTAHITEARNIADREVVLDLAVSLGHDRTAFSRRLGNPATARDVEQDRRYARRRQVHAVPTLIVQNTGARLVNGPTEDLRAQLRAAIRLTA
ncbi:Protein-disulfide isomerase [Thalassovita gelatinovora]|uniref:Protein-disulfide isomerase n=1 Tax=Thalassovita gelatinovora TaxID=53501 RepID=A0A0P1G044_THAGE|nr:DsbA family protein [Thalassovita gelatinovora]QIZ81437.1 DsbA family protein [Thalassovita gelatinovora]CUH66239.1 Protein-disulfide isomerase [Thalassovita gelatinovora]SEQ22284.1 Predicted dithiol-disulfide isomerase, DsbA family [Thalassovita gelatinovora]